LNGIEEQKSPVSETLGKRGSGDTLGKSNEEGIKGSTLRRLSLLEVKGTREKGRSIGHFFHTDQEVCSKNENESNRDLHRPRQKRA